MRVLLVDDDDDVRLVGQISLQKVGGFDTHTASSGHQALEIAHQIAPDLVLLDVMMPGIDGLEVLARLRADPKTAHLPIVFMTAKVQAHEVANYMRLGAIGVIRKPFDPLKMPAELLQIVAAATLPVPND